MCVFCLVHINPIPHFLEHPETMLDGIMTHDARFGGEKMALYACKI